MTQIYENEHILVPRVGIDSVDMNFHIAAAAVDMAPLVRNHHKFAAEVAQNKAVENMIDMRYSVVGIVLVAEIPVAMPVVGKVVEEKRSDVVGWKATADRIDTADLQSLVVVE